MNISTCDALEGDNKKTCYDAIVYAKEHKKDFILKFADPSVYLREENPISVFMAGSPGAGKTEFSKRLISELKSKGFISKDPIRIDLDEIRQNFPMYTGGNASLFQAAGTIILEKLYDHVLKKKQSAIIDGTFAHIKSIQNIERSINENRPVEIYYLYQDPVLAWDFTKKRETLEKRNIPRESFIEAFLGSRENVNLVKQRFGNNVRLNLVIKDFEKGLEELRFNIDKVDQYLQVSYTKDELEKLII